MDFFHVVTSTRTPTYHRVEYPSESPKRAQTTTWDPYRRMHSIGQAFIFSYLASTRNHAVSGRSAPFGPSQCVALGRPSGLSTAAARESRPDRQSVHQAARKCHEHTTEAASGWQIIQKVDLCIEKQLEEDCKDALGHHGNGDYRRDQVCEARCDTTGSQRGWSRHAACGRERPPASPAPRAAKMQRSRST